MSKVHYVITTTSGPNAKARAEAIAKSCRESAALHEYDATFSAEPTVQDEDDPLMDTLYYDVLMYAENDGAYEKDRDVRENGFFAGYAQGLNNEWKQIVGDA